MQGWRDQSEGLERACGQWDLRRLLAVLSSSTTPRCPVQPRSPSEP